MLVINDKPDYQVPRYIICISTYIRKYIYVQYMCVHIENTEASMPDLKTQGHTEQNGLLLEN